MICCHFQGPAQEMPDQAAEGELEEASEGEPVLEQPVYCVFQPVVHAGLPPEVWKVCEVVCAYSVMCVHVSTCI